MTPPTSALPPARRLAARLLRRWQRRPVLASLALLLIVSGLLAGIFSGSNDGSDNRMQVTATAPLLNNGSVLPKSAPADMPRQTAAAVQDDSRQSINIGQSANTDALQQSVTSGSTQPANSAELRPSEQPARAQAKAISAHSDTSKQNQRSGDYAGLRWEPVRVDSGDTMEKIFRSRSLSPGLLHEIVTHNDNTQSLTRLKAGELLDFAWHDDGSLAALKRAYDDDAWLIIERAPDGEIASRLQSRDLSTRTVETAEVINSNLFLAGQRAGMSDALIMRMAGVFAWDIDFALDIRQGDRFSVIYEQIWRDGEFLRDGDIVAASFTNQGEQFTALRFAVDGQVAYYTPAGRPMRKAFLRAPLNFTRVTSNFNPRRYHPVLKTVRPHNGTDYGAPTGTPVYAAGTGTVTASAYNNANGNYVFIRHRNQVVTKYLHLSKRSVKRGDRVQQGQTIGRVGSTGLASGPHLHYEFIVNGAHRNPRTVDLPEDPPLSADMVAKLQQQHGHLLAQLARIDEELSARLLVQNTADAKPGKQAGSSSVIAPGPQ